MINIEPSIQINNKDIEFFNSDNQKLSSDLIKTNKTDCGYEIEINYCGFMYVLIPCSGFKIKVDNNLGYINHEFTTEYYYKNPNQESVLSKNYELYGDYCNTVSRPIVHLISDKTLSFSVGDECLITFCQCYYENYVKVLFYSSNTSIVYIDESSNYLINNQRYPIKQYDYLLPQHGTDIKSVKWALLNGIKGRTEPNSPDKIIDIARTVQNLLSENQIDSLIFGSLAARLNGITTDVKDLDIVVQQKDITNAAALLHQIADKVNDIPSGERFAYKSTVIDLCYDNFNIIKFNNYIVVKHGLKYIELEGLLWFNIIRHFLSYNGEVPKRYTDKSRRTSYSLIHKCNLLNKHINTIFVDAERYIEYSDILREMLDSLSESRLEYRDIRINDPFQTNCFSGHGKFYYPIINNGSKNNCRIIVDIIPTSAVWKDIFGNIQVATVYKNDSFSVITIDGVDHPGILTCTTK